MSVLLVYDLMFEVWGGIILYVEVFVLKCLGIDNLLDIILVLVEVEDLKVNLKCDVMGIVIEVYLDKGRGLVVIVIVENGILCIGDIIVIGNIFGCICIMNDDFKKCYDEVFLGILVEIIGLD